MEIGKSCFEKLIFWKLCGNFLELSLYMKDCQSSYSRTSSERLLNVLCTFNLRPVSTGITCFLLDFSDYKYLENLTYYLLPVQH